MSEVAIRAEHGGLACEVTVSTRGTADDYRLVLDAALRAIAAALVRPTDAADFFDQDATRLAAVDPDLDLEATPTERARAARAPGPSTVFG